MVRAGRGMTSSHDFVRVPPEDDPGTGAGPRPQRIWLGQCSRCGYRWSFDGEGRPVPDFPEAVAEMTCDKVIVAEIMGG